MKMCSRRSIFTVHLLQIVYVILSCSHRRESDDALLQEGLLRHVPIVGSFVNWFSPVTEKATIKGRCLSLNEGRLSTTEPVYETKAMVNGGTTSEDAPEASEAAAPAAAAEPGKENEVASAAE